jgi:hypothetical protein
MISPDFIFSYWIFTWFLFYYFRLTDFNPLFALICGLIFNSFQLIGYLFYKNYKKALYFIIVNIIIKIIPIILIYNHKILFKDIYFTFILLIIFIIYSKIFRKNQLKSFMNSLKTKKIDSPFSLLLFKIFG